MLARSVQLAVIVMVLGSLLAPVAAEDEKSAWEKLKEGDWALYKSEPTPGMLTETKWTVTKVEGRKVTYEMHTTMTMNGNPLGEPTTMVNTVDLDEQKDKDAKAPERSKVGEESIEINDRKVACVIFSMTNEVAGQKYVTKIWESGDVPFGIVKSELNGKSTQNLVDWGNKS